MKKLLILIMFSLLVLNIVIAQEEPQCNGDNSNCLNSIYGYECLSDDYCGCIDDSHCVNHPYGTKCIELEPNIGACGCETQTNCIAGTICDETEGYCIPEDTTQDTTQDTTSLSCTSDTDCASNELEIRCDITNQICIECITDEDCALNPYGPVCSTSICIQGEPTQPDEISKALPYDEIDEEIKELLNIPNDGSVLIILNQQILDMPATFNRINEDYLPSGIIEDDVLIANSNTDVRTTMKFFTYETAESSQDLTLVKKIVNTELNNYKLIEEFPMQIAESIEEIYFSKQPNQVSQKPLVISVDGSENSGIFYLVEGNALDYISSIKTIISPIEPTIIKDGYEEPMCGDGICTDLLEDKYICPEDCKRKIRWGWIIFLVIILIIVLLYFNIYRKKKKFSLPKTPFRTPLDEQNLRNYIQQAKLSGKTKNEIIKVLMTKGWTRNQIDYIFNTTH